MAKSRTTELTSVASSAKKPVRKLKKAAQGPTAAPMIDTTLAAQHAARILAARAKLGSAAEGVYPESAAKESGNFKQLKESLNRPASHAVSSALGTSFGQQKSNLPTPGQKQVAHNQTQGVVSRVNVPRRTAG